jgi:heparinase II/III-like protein
MSWRDSAQELIELGPRGTLFRVGWELRGRVGFTGRPVLRTPKASAYASGQWTYRLQLEDPIALARVIRRRVAPARLDSLRACADAALRGEVLCFGRWAADFGDPVDWHRSPVSGGRWDHATPWFSALADERAGDVKYCWEIARFPHAYHIARAATFFPERSERYAAALGGQIAAFVDANPVGVGIHWASGQEIGLRLLAWLFALDVLLLRTASGRAAEERVAASLMAGARHIEEHLDYARIAVYNNHLLSEALALFGVGALLPEAPDALRWRTVGRRILDEEAERQFYRDGGYIQQSHNYHRVALQYYLWACSFARSMGDRPSDVWLRALERSLDLLIAHQNRADGRLPNYGSNDGALPSPLSTCDFSDMRPVLQAVSVLVRGERVYEPGPWDEETAWFLGARALDAPLRPPPTRSKSFTATGYHVLRGRDHGSFAALRCGTLRDRFSQIDMLHLDVWWRGQNVLVDPGSYQYNAAPRWHEHFMRTASHNTIAIDGRDQMLHYRQFKVLYWTKAQLLQFADRGDWAVCAGEHSGYRRHAGGCVHRRSILFVKDDLWIVADRVLGAGEHELRLHWLGGEFPWTHDGTTLALATPQGAFSVAVYDAAGSRVESTVAAGVDEPPRGWLSRYYGEKTAVPSFVVERRTAMPQTFVTVLSGVDYTASVDRGRWTIETADRTLVFRLDDGLFDSVCLA